MRFSSKKDEDDYIKKYGSATGAERKRPQNATDLAAARLAADRAVGTPLPSQFRFEQPGVTPKPISGRALGVATLQPTATTQSEKDMERNRLLKFNKEQGITNYLKPVKPTIYETPTPDPISVGSKNTAPTNNVGIGKFMQDQFNKPGVGKPTVLPQRPSVGGPRMPLGSPRTGTGPMGPPQVGGGVGLAGGRPMPAGGRPVPAGGAPMGPVRMAKGGSVSSASKRADGCAVKGKTKGRMV